MPAILKANVAQTTRNHNKTVSFFIEIDCVRVYKTGCGLDSVGYFIRIDRVRNNFVIV